MLTDQRYSWYVHLRAQKKAHIFWFTRLCRFFLLENSKKINFRVKIFHSIGVISICTQEILLHFGFSLIFICFYLQLKNTMTTVKDSATDKEKLAFSEQHYFSSYDHFGIHEEMLKDKVRTLSYRNAIMKNKHLFKDKIVLDVGCGTGVLSMFAAQAGAKHVLAVDMSNIIEMAQQVVDLNGFSDKITLIRGKLEDVVLPYDKVDIIISEWMGYFLLYESMLDTVLVARDMYLKEDGLIFPDKASIHVAMIEDEEYKNEKIEFWEDPMQLYGFDYSPFKKIAMAEPLVDIVENGSVCTSHYKLIEFDLNTVKIEDLAFMREFKVKATRDDSVHALLAWFDIDFPSDKEENVVSFSTGAHATYTHWKQTVFYLPYVLDVKKGEEITGTLACRPNKLNNRELDIEIEWDFKASGEEDSRRKEGKHNYFLR